MTTSLVRQESEVPEAAVIVRPAISIQDAKQLVHDMKEFRKHVLVKGTDYGEIPGVQKPSLFKPGAEKLLNIFGLGVRHVPLQQVEDWEKGFFSYNYRAEVYVLRSGVVISDCEGSCNSKEDKYRYRVVNAWDASEEDKKASVKTRKRKYRSKKGEYLVYYVPNNEPYSLVNTLKKMAQKRAMIGAVLIATRASEEYTQDVEDQEHEETTEPIEQQQQQQPPAPGGVPAGNPDSKGAAADAVQLVEISVEKKKMVFGECKRSGITKETFAAFYTEVTGRAFLDIYECDIAPLLEASAKRIKEQQGGTPAPAAAGATS